MPTLDDVKDALGITGTAQDKTLTAYYNDVVGFLKDSGVAEKNITAALVARGVSDIWNYGAGEGELSPYFMQRATQLAYK